MKAYDLIIIGAGPAGITAGIYAKNFGLDCLIIGEEEGGLLNGSYKIDNYPGIFNITGKDLAGKFKAHQKYLKIPSKNERIEKIKKEKDVFRIFSEENEYQAKAIILALGTKAQKIDIKNIEKFENRGVYYQTGINASLFKDKVVAVIGGANSAVMKAVTFAGKAKKVYLIYRKARLRADAIWVDKINKLKNVEIFYNANILELKGKDKLEEIVLEEGTPRRARGKLKIDSLFIEAGGVPNTVLIKDLRIKTDEKGYIKVERDQSTNVEGIFAAGDITTNSNEFRQIITACAEGAIAALGALNYLNKK